MENATEKLREAFQRKWKEQPIYDETIFSQIDENVQLHKEIRNVRSSAAACLNVIGSLNNNVGDLIDFLNQFDLKVQEIIPFPTGADIDGEVYNDVGNAIFEWIGPKSSPINERGGKRGQNRTSIDAYVLARIDDKITQILIEWKFTETYTNNLNLNKFGGIAGNERLRRYSSTLANLRDNKDFPFRMKYEDDWGLPDLGYEPFYQLLRMTLLAKTTTPLNISRSIEVRDYVILHLTHSANTALNIVTAANLRFCAGLLNLSGKPLHEIWQGYILDVKEACKFRYGFWNKNLDVISDVGLRNYLKERYA